MESGDTLADGAVIGCIAQCISTADLGQTRIFAASDRGIAVTVVGAIIVANASGRCFCTGNAFAGRSQRVTMLDGAYTATTFINDQTLFESAHATTVFIDAITLFKCTSSTIVVQVDRMSWRAYAVTVWSAHKAFIDATQEFCNKNITKLK